MHVTFLLQDFYAFTEMDDLVLHVQGMDFLL
jgi:hypothetical protein